jgi:hypothetical protein
MIDQVFTEALGSYASLCGKRKASLNMTFLSTVDVKQCASLQELIQPGGDDKLLYLRG